MDIIRLDKTKAVQTPVKVLVHQQAKETHASGGGGAKMMKKSEKFFQPLGVVGVSWAVTTECSLMQTLLWTNQRG